MRAFCRILTFVMITFAHGQVYDDDTVMRLNISRDDTRKCLRPEVPNLKRLTAESRCQPRQRLITLQPNTSDVVLSPSQVLVRRCDSDVISSRRNHVCRPKSREKRTITVNASFDPRSPKCLTVPVWDDTECTFKCSLTPASCKKGQIFSEENCECTCQNWKMKKQECEGREKTWNNDDCSCNCKNTHPCSSPRVWSEDICDCRSNN